MPKQLLVQEQHLAEFKGGFRGNVLTPADNGYEEGRKVWNGMIDRHPALIARCAGVADVIEAVKFARTHDLLIALRGGGHSVAGHSVCDGGIVIDLSPMKGIRVDPESRTVRAQGGVTWGAFDHETQAFGLATTGGIVSTTGIGGLTLGGGIGWLNGKHGLACDNLLSADVVTADGRFLKASASENEDLFWGLRGGGGNFGVVTSFQFQLHQLGPVVGGLVAYPVSRAREVLQFYREVTATAPDELTVYVTFLTAPPEPFVPERMQGTRVIALGVCYAGPVDEGERVVRPMKEFGPPDLDLVGPMPYTALQSFFDSGYAPGSQNYWKSHFLNGLTDEAIDTAVAQERTVLSPLAEVAIEHVHGAAGRVPRDGTAFPHRDAPYTFGIYPVWTDPAEADQHIQWARDFWTAMRPFSTGGVYVNYLIEEGEYGVKAAYGAAHYRRLTALKATYDPTNLFRLNQNLHPNA